MITRLYLFWAFYETVTLFKIATEYVSIAALVTNLIEPFVIIVVN